MNAKLWFLKALKLFQFIYQKTPLLCLILCTLSNYGFIFCRNIDVQSFVKQTLHNRIYIFSLDALIES